MLENTIMRKITDEYKDDLLVRMAHHSTAIEQSYIELGV